jgi:hypothetical protein
VFEKVKKGQKKCPISENPRIFGKQEFLKCVLDQNAHNFKKNE